MLIYLTALKLKNVYQEITQRQSKDIWKNIHATHITKDYNFLHVKPKEVTQLAKTEEALQKPPDGQINMKICSALLAVDQRKIKTPMR